MATPTYTPIASITLTGSASSVEFTSIPQTFRDLLLVSRGIASSSIQYPLYRFNNDTSNVYFYVQARGFGSSNSYNSSASSSTSFSNTQGITPNGGGFDLLHIFDYAGTGRKSAQQRSQMVYPGVSDPAVLMANLFYNPTTAVTSIQISGSFAADSIFSLYGLA